VVDDGLKLRAGFSVVVQDVASDRDLGALQADDFLRIAARYSDWYSGA
jgi:hypothetical protein